MSDDRITTTGVIKIETNNDAPRMTGDATTIVVATTVADTKDVPVNRVIEGLIREIRRETTLRPEHLVKDHSADSRHVLRHEVSHKDSTVHGNAVNHIINSAHLRTEGEVFRTIIVIQKDMEKATHQGATAAVKGVTMIDSTNVETRHSDTEVTAVRTHDSRNGKEAASEVLHHGDLVASAVSHQDKEVVSADLRPDREVDNEVITATGHTRVQPQDIQDLSPEVDITAIEDNIDHARVHRDEKVIE